jgi:hypothetical protein
MENGARIPKFDWGNYGEGEFIGDYISCFHTDRPVEENLEWMRRAVERLRTSEADTPDELRYTKK